MADGSSVFAVPAGDESSGSEDDAWDIGVAQQQQQQQQARRGGKGSPRGCWKGNLGDTVNVDEALKQALTTGNLSMVEELLHAGVSVESTFKFGWTPLMYAASVVNVELMRILLDRGANASFDKNQYTVLMAACAAQASEEQILKCVELLLSRNANPNTACRKKMTPLMYAAREGYPQVVALLAAHGSQINAQDENGNTALTWAARQGHKKVVFKLLALGADKSIQTKDGQTPGEIAKNSKHSELFSFLCLTANPLQGRFQSLNKEEAMHRLLKAVPDAVSHKIRCSSYTAFGDLEVFLHGLGLEYLADILKERDITLRQLLTMGKEDFMEIGIEDTRDQQKILDAVKELQVEEVKLGELSGVISLEFSGDEFLSFLMKLNRQCIHLITAIQSVINQFPKDSHKLVLEWSSPQSLAKVCEDLVLSAEDLTGEVSKLRLLMQKLHEGQKDDHCRIQPLGEKGHRKTFFKVTAVTLFGSGCIFLISMLMLRKC
ncbi:hypothetical protein lerEdw1_007450 [Lerista edwardsae]|nr:hypothetical protein lerEdw1_007450 [Lerista edwardsae]